MNKINRTIITATLGLCLASCSVFNGNGPVIRIPGILPDPKPEKSATPTPDPAPVPEDMPVVFDSVPITHDKKPTQQINVTDSSKKDKLSGQIEGEWLIVKAGKYAINNEDDMPYINFNQKEGRFYASNGCNILNGNFSITGESTVELSNVLSTMMLCQDAPYQSIISRTLSDTNVLTASIEAFDHEWQMTLSGNSGQTLKLKRQNAEGLTGIWVVDKIGQRELDGDLPNIFIDMPELTIHGNTGCNFFNGIILLDPQAKNSIAFSQMSVTMRMCENIDVETSMLVALEMVTNYKLSKDGNLTLIDDSGNALLHLSRP